jgi:site-specific recombinase XerD
VDLQPVQVKQRLWLAERPGWPGATSSPALLLNRRGTRLSVRGASNVFHTIAEAAGLDEATTAHTGRHTFATTLIRGGTDLVLVADLLGHARSPACLGPTQMKTMVPRLSRLLTAESAALLAPPAQILPPGTRT